MSSAFNFQPRCPDSIPTPNPQMLLEYNTTYIHIHDGSLNKYILICPSKFPLHSNIRHSDAMIIGIQIRIMHSSRSLGNGKEGLAQKKMQSLLE